MCTSMRPDNSDFLSSRANSCKMYETEPCKKTFIFCNRRNIFNVYFLEFNV